jgi:hypothetical protein
MHGIVVYPVLLYCRWWRGSAKLLKQLTGAPLEVAEAVRQQLQEFQQHVPLIAALRNPGLRDRHWDKISAAVGCPVKADAGVHGVCVRAAGYLVGGGADSTYFVTCCDTVIC